MRRRQEWGWGARRRGEREASMLPRASGGSMALRTPGFGTPGLQTRYIFVVFSNIGFLAAPGNSHGRLCWLHLGWWGGTVQARPGHLYKDLRSRARVQTQLSLILNPPSLHVSSSPSWTLKKAMSPTQQGGAWEGTLSRRVYFPEPSGLRWPDSPRDPQVIRLSWTQS